MYCVPAGAAAVTVSLLLPSPHNTKAAGHHVQRKCVCDCSLAVESIMITSKKDNVTLIYITLVFHIGWCRCTELARVGTLYNTAYIIQCVFSAYTTISLNKTLRQQTPVS